MILPLSALGGSIVTIATTMKITVMTCPKPMRIQRPSFHGVSLLAHRSPKPKPDMWKSGFGFWLLVFSFGLLLFVFSF